MRNRTEFTCTSKLFIIIYSQLLKLETNKNYSQLKEATLLSLSNYTNIVINPRWDAQNGLGQADSGWRLVSSDQVGSVREWRRGSGSTGSPVRARVSATNSREYFYESGSEVRALGSTPRGGVIIYSPLPRPSPSSLLPSSPTLSHFSHVLSEEDCSSALAYARPSQPS